MSTEPVARYSFVPWVRQGLSSSITTADSLADGGLPGAERASITVNVQVNATDTVSKQVDLVGPGDIKAIEAEMVVRTEPKHWATDFEPNYLAFIEFYDEDYVWRFTPAANAANKLRPWICLIVLEEGEFERGSMTGTLPVIELQVPAAQVMPPLTQMWAWGHVHVNRDIRASDGTPAQVINNLEVVLNTNTDLAISRLMCPRKLKPNTAYYAFVIPTFETGRLTGLGADIPAGADGLASAWGAGQTTFPVLYEWFFRTSMQGDFEYLVRLLQPRILDPRIGIRPMDVQRSGVGLPAATAFGFLGLEGALKTPDTQSTVWTDTALFQNGLTALANLPEDLIDGGSTASPTIAPPIYGRWHGLVRRLRAAGNPRWLDQLNLDPRNRAAAGFGTLVMQKHQEELMNQAWRQIGDLKEVNVRLRRSQLSREAGIRLYQRYMAELPQGQFVAITAAVHPRVRLMSGMATPKTVRAAVRESSLPRAVLDPAFRRISGPRGPLIRRALQANLAGDTPGSTRRTALQDRFVERTNSGEITAAPPKAAPPGAIKVNNLADQLTSPTLPGCLSPIWYWFRYVVLFLIAVLTVAGRVSSGARRLADRLRAWMTNYEAVQGVREENLTPETIRRIPARPGFVITHAGDPLPTLSGSGGDSPAAANLRAALLDLHTRFGAAVPAVTPVPLNLAAVSTEMLSLLQPARTIPARILSTLRLPAEYHAGFEDPIRPIMASPDFPQPMYEPLRDISPELLIPGVDLIPANTISLLETNPCFIESYMVGLNHEMARELLWREFPTDQQASYFRQFWDVSDVMDDGTDVSAADRAEALKDIPHIHTWPRSADLGENDNNPSSGVIERLVLVIRGDLLKRYPTAVIYAVKGQWADDPHATRRRLPDRSQIKTPIFKAKIDLDITFLGFELIAEEARGSDVEAEYRPGWFFAIEERPGEARFGLDDPIDGFAARTTARTWNELSWAHLSADQASYDALNMIDFTAPLQAVSITGGTPDAAVRWGADSADMASILLQVPVRIYVHASEMLH